MTDWNPSLYLKFEKERTQPVKDLISHIEKDQPLRIIDIGCGPGNSTRELQNKWPNAHIIGLDSSPNMIEKAKKDLPDIEWIVGDAGADLSHLGKFDIVFSNAAIQWVPNHERLLNKLFSMLKEEGALAIQIPNAKDMEINIAVETTATDAKWKEYFNDLEENIFYNVPEFYYDVMCNLTKEIYLWETYYYHVMKSHQEIINWYRSTGMKPFLDKLPNETLKKEFEDDVLNKIKKEYKVQGNGNVLFPFRRIFLLGYKH